MICYKDKTFCESDCTNASCYRFFSEVDQIQAKKWWGGDNPPIAFSDFSADCGDYRK